MKPLLSIEDLSLSFHMYNGGFQKETLTVMRHLNIEVHAGEIVAIFGSSGSGKSLLAHSIMGILPGNAELSGKMYYNGKEMTALTRKKLRGKEIAFVPQSVNYLDPLMKLGKQVIGVNGKKDAVNSAFKQFGLKQDVAKMYPYQLSGGMARRALISTAVTTGAQLIIADEPTPGLSPELAQEVLNNFRELANKGCGILLITHDIDLALPIADKIAVFYGGSILEITPAADFVKGKNSLRHPYTKALWQALPQNGFQIMPGTQPYAREGAQGCIFSARCKRKTPECRNPVKMREVRGGKVCCVHAT